MGYAWKLSSLLGRDSSAWRMRGDKEAAKVLTIASFQKVELRAGAPFRSSAQLVGADYDFQIKPWWARELAGTA